MGSLLLVLVVVLVVAALVFGVVALLTNDDAGLGPAEPDGRAVPLPTDRPLEESDVSGVRFDYGIRGYRMEQVDRALRRTAYDIGYKDEMIAVLEAEVNALREGRGEDAELLRQARTAADQNEAQRAAEPVGAATAVAVLDEERSVAESVEAEAEAEALTVTPAVPAPAFTEPEPDQTAEPEPVAAVEAEPVAVEPVAVAEPVEAEPVAVAEPVAAEPAAVAEPVATEPAVVPAKKPARVRASRAKAKTTPESPPDPTESP